ncbi:hypothetical protein ACIO3O_22915 [Streptomyces sp. NPDC087440]|uniref:hypothetical protein n=1 Tax=Streptomyces sp. NPDC087440 TaxID=3365790 RepID=UPI00380A88B8
MTTAAFSATAVTPGFAGERVAECVVKKVTGGEFSMCPQEKVGDEYAATIVYTHTSKKPGRAAMVVYNCDGPGGDLKKCGATRNGVFTAMMYGIKKGQKSTLTVLTTYDTAPVYWAPEPLAPLELVGTPWTK